MASTDRDDGAPAVGSTEKKDAQSYEEEIRKLKTQLGEKDKQLADLQKGLEAQVHMVMELENLEQKEQKVQQQEDIGRRGCRCRGRSS